MTAAAESPTDTRRASAETLVASVVATIDHAPASLATTLRRKLALSATEHRASSVEGTAGTARIETEARVVDRGATLPKLDVVDETGASSGELELVRKLGEGGMGIVWLAWQRSLEREVAVKALRGGASGLGTLLEEARATGALEHPSIVPVHALGVDAQGSPLLVMKRIDGVSLDALLRDEAHPAWSALEARYGDRLSAKIEVLIRVADALEFAHARGFVHRDVKPENVMVGAFGEVYLVDWGIALKRPDRADTQPSEPPVDARTTRGAIVGTPCFLAPEMVRGDLDALDARTDVYLLGATLHTVLTGTPRHGGATLSTVLVAALLSDPVEYDASVPAELAELANRATAAEPDARPASAAAFRQALADFLRHRGSMRLTEESVRRLESLRAATRPEDLASPEAARALAECRFGFTQALREWPGNQLAKAGLQQTLRSLVEAELQRRSPDGAAAIASELETPDAAFEARIDALRASVVGERALAERALREAHERDPRVAARQRMWIAIGFIAVTVVLVVLGWRSELAHHGERSMGEVLVYDGVLLAVGLALVVTQRRSLLANRLGRQAAIVLVGVLVAAGMSDTLMAIRGAHPSEAGPFSLLAMASVLGGSAIGVSRRFAWSALAFVVGAFVCASWPAWTVPAIGGASIAAVLFVLRDSLDDAR